MLAFRCITRLIDIHYMDLKRIATRVASMNKEASMELFEAAAAAAKVLGKSVDMNKAIADISGGIMVSLKGGGRLSISLS